ncbi:MAG: SMC family ATPase [Acidimicrobiia bacterium]|nr:SMC family ATPase [Acidimicrobiia bacterium]
MRPRRLELEGFTSFRGRTVVDFDGADLFAFCGPTGAGKSSLIDAIVFALYGAVPRYDDLRAVAPVVSQSRNEAVVSLEFSVGGDDYVATRVVRRTKGKGATTKEARLERVHSGGDPEVLAGTADEVTKAVEGLLGLGFEHFTRCVVLPQGEFAQFLLDKPKDRQALLMRLLDLGVYEQMGKRARERAASLATEVKVLDGKLEQIGAASEELVAGAAQRCRETEALEARLRTAEPQLQALQESVRRGRDDAATASDAIAVLGAVQVPDGIGDIAEAVAVARRAVAEAEAREAAAADTLREATAAVDELPDAGVLGRVRAAHERRAKLAAQIHDLGESLTPLAAAEDDATTAAKAADEQVEVARRHLRSVQDSHLAHTLAETLAPGEPCPVCAQTVTTVPSLDTPAEVPAAQAALQDAEAQADAARATASAAARDHRDAAGQLQRLHEQEAELAAELAEAPTADECAQQQRRRTELEETVRSATSTFDTARADHAKARQALDGAEKADKDARGRFLAGRDRVAAWTPPEPGQEDLRDDWAALARWAADLVPAQRDALAGAEAAVAKAESTAAAVVTELCAAAAEIGIEVDDVAGLTAGVPRAAEQARIAHATAETNLAQARSLRTEMAGLEAARKVADTLGRHLKTDGFQTWLQREAQEQLVIGASEILEELSGGAYSLALDDKASGFDVIDHRNADQPRSARTLSGGETFLASLALALALGEHIASMATRGAARLESLFLDEGFGTLDADTLDVVAAAIEELGAGGRMVGLVTHVSDLAERVPLRFEVSNGPNGSAVERIES